ncbi:hypothetical protein OESDEN_25589, partial [Oesophagostomum dentatum]
MMGRIFSVKTRSIKTNRACSCPARKGSLKKPKGAKPVCLTPSTERLLDEDDDETK